MWFWQIMALCLPAIILLFGIYLLWGGFPLFAFLVLVVVGMLLEDIFNK